MSETKQEAKREPRLMPAEVREQIMAKTLLDAYRQWQREGRPMRVVEARAS